MELDKFIEGLQTLQPYYDKPNGFHIGAEHDIFYAYPTDKPLPKEAIDKMIELGWHQPEVDMGDDKDFEAKHYDAKEGWAIFT